MNRLEFDAELVALGHEYIAVARRNRFVDWAVRRVVHYENWPARYVEENSVTMAAATIGQIDDVRSGTRRLGSNTQSNLVSAGVTLTQVGEPVEYYVLGGLVKTWPVAAAGVTVAHFSRRAWTTGGLAAAGDTDTPVLPVDFDDLMVMEARLHCLEDTDEDGLRNAISERALVEFTRLRDLHLNTNADEAADVERTEGDQA